jgi:predicted helicase
VLSALRGMIDKAERENPQFRKAATKFLKHAQDTINPSVTAADVREMLVQHILTEEIFSHVFDNSDFHRRNNVAKELYRLEETFFTGSVKNTTLVASSCRTSQCSASIPPSATRTTSAAIQFLGLPIPENRPWTIT